MLMRLVIGSGRHIVSLGFSLIFPAIYHEVRRGATVARVVCQTIHRPKRLTILWSEGAASFEPYHLEGVALEALYEAARQARQRLAEAATADFSAAAGDLANLGHQLYRHLFQLDSPGAAAQSVHAWWQDLVAKGGVASLEMVSDRTGCVPWNLVYDEVPDAAALAAGPGSAAWQHFWGFRFVLGVGRRVSPHRVFPYLDKPELLVALDPVLESELPGAERHQLDHFLTSRNVDVVRSVNALAERLREQVPDVLVVISRVERGRVLLGDHAASLRDVRQAMTDAEAGNPQPLVLLLGSGDTDAMASWECWLAAATSELSSVVAPETPASPALNIRAGLHWLAQFLQEGIDAGSALQATRQELGLSGLAFSAFCPPYVRVLAEGREPDAEVPEPTVYHVPAKPYRGLMPFDREDRALFLGREDDTVRFARLLDEAGTRGVILHGGAGVGKASLLRAGVVPYLEDEALGYRAWRDRSDLANTLAERDYPTLALRAGGDLAGQLGAALSAFCAQPFTYGTPAGGAVTVDLPGILRRHGRSAAPASNDLIQANTPTAVQALTMIAAGAPSNIVSILPTATTAETAPLAATLAEDSTALGRLLDDITARLPFELAIVIEQADDLLTETTTKAKERRQAALAMLADVSMAPARCKVILTLRTELVGRLGDGFATGKERAAWRDFYLAPLSAKALTESLLAPTATEPPLYAPDVPHERYRLAFAPGVMDKIVMDSEALAAQQQVGAVTLAQAACAFVAERAHERNQTLIRMEDLTDLRSIKKGRVDVGLDRYVAQRLAQLPVSNAAQRSLRILMGRLHARQADGVLTRPLLPARDLAQHWRGGDTLEKAVNAAAAPEAGLLEVQHLRVGAREGLTIGLAHDGLAAWSALQKAEAERRQYARSRVIDALFILVPLMLLAVAVTYYLMRGQVREEQEAAAQAGKEREFFKQYFAESHAAAAPLYAGALAQADQALRAGNMLRARQHLLSQQPFASMEKEQLIDRRGFEWRYLWRLANPERQTLSGHRGLVNAVAAAPDNSLIATAGADGTVRLWNLKRQGEVGAIFTGHPSPVMAVAFAPDSKTLASADADGHVHVWDVKIGLDEPLQIEQTRKQLVRHKGAVNALAFGQDANTLLSGGADKTVLVWDVAAGEPKATLKDHVAPIQAVAAAPGGKTFASADGEQSIIVWDGDGWKKTTSIKAPGAVAGLAFAPDGAVLAAAGHDALAGGTTGAIRFWDAKSGKEATPTIHHSAGFFGVSFKPKSTIVVAAGKDHTVRAWDMKTGHEQLALRGHLGWVKAIAVTPDGATVATSSHDNTVKLWDWTAASDTLLHGAGIQALAISVDNELLASGGRDGVVKLWRTATGELAGEIKGHPGPITGLAFVADAAPAKEGGNPVRKLVVGSFGDTGAGSVKIWDVALAFRKLVTKEGPAFEGHAKGVLCLALAKNQLLATGSADGTAILWDLANGRKKQSLSAENPVQTIAFSPSGSKLATGDRRGLVRLWDEVGGQFQKRGAGKPVTAHVGGVHALIFRGEDYDFLSGGADLAIKHWAWKADRSPEAGLVARAYQQPIGCLAMLGDTAFASGGWDGAVKFWDLRDGPAAEERFTLLAHTGPVGALATTSNRQLLVSGGHDGKIRLWRSSSPAK